jgi:DNA-binding MarR family transcriptional regulator
MASASAALAQRALQDLRIELGAHTDRVALAAGLKPSDLSILDVVVHEGPISPSRLADRACVHRATLTGVLARLEREGWVERRRDAHDGRAAVIHAVARRVQVLHRLFKPVDRRLTRATADLTEKEWAVVVRYLDLARQAVRNAPLGR